MAKKSAKGSGTIRKKTVTRNGREYTYWEARVTTGRDPGTGRQLQRSFTGKTQKEVREKMQAAAVEVNQGTYTAPSRLTVGQWLDIWQQDYLGNVKPNTTRIYGSNVKNHLKPALGAIRLNQLRPHDVQNFVNDLTGLSAASVHLAYKVLHMALEKAVELDYIPKNPAARCVLPRGQQTEIKPLEDGQAAALLTAAKGTDLEHLVTVALFTGCRLSELLGLTWGAVDFAGGTITIYQQLMPAAMWEQHGLFATPKNGKNRTLSPAPSVMAALRAQRIIQAEEQLKAGPVWDNKYDLVFTTATGQPFSHTTIERHFSAVVKAAGLQGVRFHDLRHTYAVNAIRAGDDIKTIQGSLGHGSAAFTLDRYGHVTERMRRDSAGRMEAFMKGVLNL